MYKDFKQLKTSLRILNKCTTSILSKCVDDANYPLVKRCKGPFLYDYDGNRYVDFSLDEGSLNLGHSHPKITAVMKSWLGRGYGEDHLTASVTPSHQALSKKLWSAVWGEGETPDMGGWVFVFSTSAHEAFSRASRAASAAGVQVLGPPFVEDRLKSLESGAGGTGRPCVLSDEKGFHSHVAVRNRPGIALRLGGRMVGSWAAAGIPFGCVMLDASRLGLPRALEEASPCAGSLPLYLVKAASESIALRERLGGVAGLLARQRVLVQALDERFFAPREGIAFVREEERLAAGYGELRGRLLREGILLPISPREPLSVSLAHDEELLARCARRINSTFARFFR
jgi:hypothetical protein